MSMGYGGTARGVLQDEKTVVYEYFPYNLNNPEYRNSGRVFDGLITISKDALVEPEIHKKVKRMPSGKKRLIVKRLRRDVDYRTLLKEGAITIENSKNCWYFVGTEKDIGMIAMKITFNIFNRYQDNGLLPEMVSINY